MHQISKKSTPVHFLNSQYILWINIVLSLQLVISWYLQSLTPANSISHGLRTPREEIAFTARPKIHSHSQIFWYGGSIFCLPHRPNFSGIFDLCLHWVSVVRDSQDQKENSLSVRTFKTQSSVVIVFYEKRSCRFQMEQQEISGMQLHM